MLTSAGRGRGRAKLPPKNESFFMENAPMPACWASPDKSKIGNGSSPVNVQEVYETPESTGSNNVEDGPRKLNPEEQLELANNDSGVDLGRELSPAQEESAEVRSFTFTKLHFDPKLSQEKRREHILNWQKK